MAIRGSITNYARKSSRPKVSCYEIMEAKHVKYEKAGFLRRTTVEGNKSSNVLT